MNTIKLQQRGVLTLPKKVRDSLNVSEGDVFTVSQNKNQIILERTNTSDSALLNDIKQSLKDIQDGKFIEFGSIPEFKKKLKEYDAN